MARVFWLLCLGLASSPLAHGYSMFRDQIPNGRQVPHPCKPNYLWHGVGHMNEDGGGRRNPFGQDFEAGGKKWTAELCRKDSDGDGRTNGQELGDPNCTWKVGVVPDVTTGLSHPGVADPYDDPKFTQQNSFVKCDEGTLDCPSLKSPDIQTVEVRMPRSKVPAKTTTYVCTSLDLPGDKPYHLVGMTPLVDNREVLHHAILFGCQDDGGPVGTAGECKMGDTFKYCKEHVVLWSLGSAGYCFRPDVGFAFGKGGLTRVMLQVHYTNPAHRTDYSDASGMKLYYTDVKRKYDGGTLMIGQNRLAIPPAQPASSFSGTCPASCTQKWGQSIFILDAALHAHYLATDLEVTHSKGKTSSSLFREQPYSYDRPKFHQLTSPLEVRPGEELSLRCTYQSLNRKSITKNGASTYDEMCYAFLMYYPRHPAITRCVQSGTRAACGSSKVPTSDKCDLKFAQSVRGPLTEVVKACGVGCSAPCAAAVKAVMSHKCSSDANFLSLLSKSGDDGAVQFVQVFTANKDCKAGGSGTKAPPTADGNCTPQYLLTTTQGRRLLQALPRACPTCSAQCKKTLRRYRVSPCLQEPGVTALRTRLLESGGTLAKKFFDTLDKMADC